MSVKTQMPATQADVAAPNAVAQVLTPVVRDLIALAVNAKQAHWHMRGANFLGVHQFLDEVVAHAQSAADEAAERIIALGLPVDAQLGAVASHTSTPEMKAGFQQWRESVSAVIAQVDAVLATVYAAIESLEEVDPVSQDLAIAIAQQLDKDRWFLYSHLAE